MIPPLVLLIGRIFLLKSERIFRRFRKKIFIFQQKQISSNEGIFLYNFNFNNQFFIRI